MVKLILREHLKGSFTWRHHDEIEREKREREKEREGGRERETERERNNISGIRLIININQMI